ncbi:hypothetical protein K1719_032334 [Acacia pycnantha]|nr:hypothetical protein K1719_032334 [Acacia pycnantha]
MKLDHVAVKPWCKMLPSFVVVPTRDLALKVKEVFDAIAFPLDDEQVDGKPDLFCEDISSRKQLVLGIAAAHCDAKSVYLDRVYLGKPLHSLAWSSPLSNSLRKSRLLIWLIDQLINHSIGCCRKGLLNYKTILRVCS